MRNVLPLPALIETICDTVRQSLENFAENQPFCNEEERSSQLVSHNQFRFPEKVLRTWTEAIYEEIRFLLVFAFIGLMGAACFDTIIFPLGNCRGFRSLIRKRTPFHEK